MGHQIYPDIGKMERSRQIQNFFSVRESDQK